MTRRDFALLLALSPGVGGKTLTRVLARNDMLGRSAEEFLKLSPEAMREEYKMSAAAASGLSERSKERIDLWKPMQERLDKLGVTLITAADAQYPDSIESFDSDPPAMLFLYGNKKLLEGKTFCVLSSRNCSPAGLRQMEELVEEGVLNGEPLVTGHDTPEYQQSAVVPLRWGAPRILCLDRGMFPVLGENLTEEPFRAARLWRYRFDPSVDLVVSPFHPDSKFSGIGNKVRDRLVGGLSRRIDLVEITPGGNMERLAKMGLKAGREVRVSDRSVGYLSLRALGATVIRS